MKFDPNNASHVTRLINETVGIIRLFITGLTTASEFTGFIEVNDVIAALEGAQFPEGFSVTPDEIRRALVAINTISESIVGAFDEDTREAFNTIIQNIGVIDGTG